MDYYEWLNSFIDVPIKMVENCLNKRFNYDLELASGAAKHTEWIFRMGNCFHSPDYLRGSAKAELVQYNKQAVHSDDGVEKKIKNGLTEIANNFLGSRNHRHDLNVFANIGAGIAIREIDGWLLFIYFTIRLN